MSRTALLNNMIGGLPPVLSTPASWIGAEMLNQQSEWLWGLSSDEIGGLEQAMQKYIASSEPLQNITPEKFRLPVFGPRLAKLRSELVNGRGFGVLRGLNVARYSRTEIATLFMGIGVHIGCPRSQNAAGHLLGHVRNVGANANDLNVRIYQTSERQTFHTDSCDVVALLCLQTAQSGGASLLVSVESIFNAMRAQRPDLAACLFDPVATDKRGEVEADSEPFFTIPVLSWYAGKLSGIYQRQYIDSAQRFENAPKLSAEYIEALDLFDALANDSRLNFSMQLETGDMQFVHNHSMLHDRNGFIDWPDADKRRHLLRLWLSTPGDRPLPNVFAQRLGTTEVGNRGGVMVEGTKLQVPID
jgi:hypothetical protein